MARNTEAEFRELSEGDLAMQSAKEAIKLLQEKVDKGESVPMSEFTKILIWAANIRKKEFAEYIEKARKEGAEFKNRTWCGVPYHEFKIPSLGLF